MNREQLITTGKKTEAEAIYKKKRSQAIYNGRSVAKRKIIKMHTTANNDSPKEADEDRNSTGNTQQRRIL